MENTLQKKETIGQIPAHVIQGTDAISRKTNNDSTILGEEEKNIYALQAWLKITQPPIKSDFPPLTP